MTDKERIFNYHLSQSIHLASWPTASDVFQSPENGKHIVLAMMVLHNIMRTQYPEVQNAVLDNKGDDHRLIPGLWRTDVVMQEIDEVRAPTGETRRGKMQRLLLKNFVNSPQSSPMAMRYDLDKDKERRRRRREK